MGFRGRSVIAGEGSTMSDELQQPISKGGRPRKTVIDIADTAGLLDAALKTQSDIMLDRKANSATRQRAADSVAELIAARTRKRDDDAKTALKAENARLQSDLSALTERVESLTQESVGKVPVTEVAAMRTELTRLRSEAQAHGTRLSAIQSERDSLQIGLKYMVETLGSEGCQRAAMKSLIDGKGTRSILALFGVDARAWLQMNTDHNTKSALLDVFKKRTADRETPLTKFCRLRLSVEHNIDDVETYLQQEEQRRLEGEAQRLADMAFVNVERRLGR
jgi:hypothetical protein